MVNIVQRWAGPHRVTADGSPRPGGRVHRSAGRSLAQRSLAAHPTVVKQVPVAFIAPQAPFVKTMYVGTYRFTFRRINFRRGVFRSIGEDVLRRSFSHKISPSAVVFPDLTLAFTRRYNGLNF